MPSRKILVFSAIGLLSAIVGAFGAGVSPVGLRCEYLPNPTGIDDVQPRLSWRVESAERGQRQTAYRLLVASRPEKLEVGQGDLWDSGKESSAETANILYAGKPLTSRQLAFWKVQAWDKAGQPSSWSEPARWSMGLLKSTDWTAQWISFRDTSPLHTNRSTLFLPPARHYRKVFDSAKAVQRATLYASALGLCELHLNGQRIGDAWFEPGWADYRQRAYYRTHDVTSLMKRGANCVGAIVAEGWYSGYVGYGLLVGYGPNKVGRTFYGKTPALLAQLEIEYTDGSRDVIGTDTTWQVSGDGPIREADMIMGESFEAERDDPSWCRPGRLGDASGPGARWSWAPAIRAEDNGSTRATFFDNCGSREVELGFQRPPRLQAYSAPPIRVTQRLKTRKLTEPAPGVYVFDLGQNFAGAVGLKVKGAAGTKVRLRYGEMLHRDGRLMTENLRKARATDYYTLRGDDGGETWQPRFTYHGFQFVEIAGLPEKPGLDAITGLVLHNDTPLVGEFACSDEVMTQFWKNTVWTQRANFIEIPTDCPQRDERLGWMGDAQIYVRTASYNADVAAFFTKWLDDVEEAQRDFGAYPDYCPYPMGHGEPGQTWGTAWTDAGIICPYTIWQVYGDARVVERHWASMTRFMDWRKKRAPDFRGRKDGNTWGDWLNVNENTPIELIDAAYFKLDAQLMSEMARAIRRATEAAHYDQLQARIADQFAKDYLTDQAALKVETQTAHVLTLAFGMAPEAHKKSIAADLVQRIARNDYRMATGFLGTKPLLPVLSANGHHDLAVRLFQSRRFPSWGYEVEQGANSVWERWDSYTREHGFEGAGGSQNASMNSFSHYSFGAVMEWAFRDLAGIDTDGPGFQRLRIRPGLPAPGSNPDRAPIDWVKAKYLSAHGEILSQWKRTGGRFELALGIPANTSATVFLPARDRAAIRESGRALGDVSGVEFLRMEGDRAVLKVESGTYHFESTISQ
ncbi:MAG: family 78 glycoside hydrolase catalytic domain [Verrucomicrobiia bacterium]